MKYKAELILMFDTESDAKKVIDYAKTLISKSTSINEDKENIELSYITLGKHYHDETPTKPCEVLEQQEVRNGQVIIVKEAIAMER